MNTGFACQARSSCLARAFGRRYILAMPASLPELATINLRRGASNGAELRIELNRPERMNAWDRGLGLDLLAAV